jgi:catabolite regulation protein CreA
MNNYNFTGKGNVLIRATSAGVYGAKTFLANEPIAYLTEVDIVADFSNTEKIATQGARNLASSSDSSMSFVSLSNVKISDTLLSMLYTKQEHQEKEVSFVFKGEASGGALFLPITQEDDLIASSVFVYNQDKERQSNFTVDTTNNLISGLTNGQIYTVFYTLGKNDTTTFSLSNPTIPNVKIEISVAGNVNKKSGVMTLKIPKAKIVSRPQMDLMTEQPFSENLSFAVMGNENPEVIYYG